MASDCAFCHEINEWKDVHKNYEFTPVYYVKIAITHMVKNKEKGELTSKKHKLSFCPMCGKKLDLDTD